MENSYPKIFTESFNLKPVRRAIYLLVSDAMQFHVQFITAFLCGLPLSSVLLLVVFLCGCYAVPCSVPCSLPVWVVVQEALLGGWDGGESGRGKVVSRTYSYSPVCLVGRLGWGSAAKFCCDVLHL